MTRTRAKGAEALAKFIDLSPSPFHACQEAARLLAEAGFQSVEECDPFPQEAGAYYLVRGGTLVAWSDAGHSPLEAGFRVIGAHTDSPNLRVKPQPDRSVAGYRQLAIEVYGGALYNSWLDRDLGMSGRVYLRDAEGARPELFRVERPIARVPQLAVHLHRTVNSEGLLLNPQTQLTPVWGLARSDAAGFQAWLAELVGAEPGDVLAWDAMLHDLTPSTLAGEDDAFLFAPRLDNLCSSWSALGALLESAAAPQSGPLPVVALFDHEEIGSNTARGAGSSVLRVVLERIALAKGLSREELFRAVAQSICLSADMAHAAHPNYLEKHDPEHLVHMNRGPVIKVNVSQRYASEAETEAIFQRACERAEVPFQKYSHRNDLMCGSTIGPLSAANLGMRTVDVGGAQLSMHSAREMCGAHDPDLMTRAMAAFLE